MAVTSIVLEYPHFQAHTNQTILVDPSSET